MKALLHDSLAELRVACSEEQGYSPPQAQCSPLLVPEVKRAVSFLSFNLKHSILCKSNAIPTERLNDVLACDEGFTQSFSTL